MYNFRNRWYSPTTQTWTQQDPAGYVDGANTYQLELSSPVCSVDPHGLAEAPTQPSTQPATLLGIGSLESGTETAFTYDSTYEYDINPLYAGRLWYQDMHYRLTVRDVNGREVGYSAFHDADLWKIPDTGIIRDVQHEGVQRQANNMRQFQTRFKCASYTVHYESVQRIIGAANVLFEDGSASMFIAGEMNGGQIFDQAQIGVLKDDGKMQEGSANRNKVGNKTVSGIDVPKGFFQSGTWRYSFDIIGTVNADGTYNAQNQGVHWKGIAGVKGAEQMNVPADERDQLYSEDGLLIT
jgi:hypothetical protein